MNLNCIANNQNANVTIRLFETEKNISLQLLPNRQNAKNPSIICDPELEDSCNVTLRAILSPGFTVLNNIKTITCSVENKSKPYEFLDFITYDLDFNCKKNKIYFTK